MREIKFRAWDTRRKEMEQCYDLYWFEENRVHQNGDFNYILMQYTGRKDKDGKEVYEGDIVNYRVSRLGGLPEQEVKSQLVHYDGNGNLKMGIYSAWFCHHEEIIGNKWENPELEKPQ